MCPPEVSPFALTCRALWKCFTYFNSIIKWFWDFSISSTNFQHLHLQAGSRSSLFPKDFSIPLGLDKLLASNGSLRFTVQNSRRLGCLPNFLSTLLYSWNILMVSLEILSIILVSMVSRLAQIRLISLSSRALTLAHFVSISLTQATITTWPQVTASTFRLSQTSKGITTSITLSFILSTSQPSSLSPALLVCGTSLLWDWECILLGLFGGTGAMDFGPDRFESTLLSLDLQNWL